jgi:hypothetical protein
MHQQYLYILHVSLESHKNIHGSQVSSVGILCNAAGWTILGLNPGRSMSFLFSPKYLDWFWDPPTLLLNRDWRFYPGHEPHHSPTTNIKVKNKWNYTSTTHCICLHGMNRANFTFYTQISIT